MLMLINVKMRKYVLIYWDMWKSVKHINNLDTFSKTDKTVALNKLMESFDLIIIQNAKQFKLIKALEKTWSKTLQAHWLYKI